MDDIKTRTYGIAELAREFDVTTRTIRFYEDQGLIAPERDGQRRIYSPRDRVRLRLIMRGKRLGFSLPEIKDTLDLYDSDPSEVKQLTFLLERIGDRKQALLDQRDDLEIILGELEKLESHCQELLASKEN